MASKFFSLVDLLFFWVFFRAVPFLCLIFKHQHLVETDHHVFMN